MLPGSLKRKLTGPEGSLGSVNGLSDGPMSQGSGKRLCLEDVTMGTGYPQPPFSSGPGVGGQGGINSRNNNNGLESPYMPTKVSPAGSAPGGAGGGGGMGGGMASPFGNNGGSVASSVEQELQDILEELTKNPDPTLPELDIEKILGSKEDEGTAGGGPGPFMHPDEAGTPKCSPPRPSHLEAHLTRSPGFPQAGSPQVGLSPAGAPYPLSHPSKPVLSPLSASPLSSSSSSSQAQNQARSPMLSAALSSRGVRLAVRDVPHALLGLLVLLGRSLSAVPARGQAPQLVPHQQPFSPAGSSIQSPQSSLISSLAPAPAQGPSPPYRPEKLTSPALAQPPFSPQSALLPSGSVPQTGGSIQGSQASYLGPGATTAGATRPSPPYRQDPKHGSPGVGMGVPSQQQNGSAVQNSQLFKAITSSQPAPSNLKLLMQQGQQGPTSAGQSVHQPMAPGPMGKGPGGGPDSFSFNNTKPLRHFDPDLTVAAASQQQQKMGGPASLPSPAASGNGGHGPMGGPAYRGPSMQTAPPASAAVAASHNHLFQQRMQRAMQRGSGPGGMVCREVSDPLSDPILPHKHPLSSPLKMPFS
ncbi:hypothetical protein AALO_G00296280 [Alosa alosa]|uniref:Mastermind-like domain-containing protein 1 n=1 Tax=Alosa alosa TaxID=278164 RepID=A0AAV6FEC4_9TELE|nr:hypothetical protein AALO_G00296280 [Alosa alosa]